jgi:ribosomal protein S18 acetylase RimI-like enzyme
LQLGGNNNEAKVPFLRFTLIKIEPLFATDSTQVRALLRYQDEPMPYESFCAEERLLFTGLNFWQHWLPCQLHVAPSVYLAKEDGIVLGLISLRPSGKSKTCWHVDHLVVHPNQRGRGIAQELLRFAFALFGSQGVGHFVAEISDQNPAALGLLGSCGFRRCARITHYQVPADLKLSEASTAQTPFAWQCPKTNQVCSPCIRTFCPRICARLMAMCWTIFAFFLSRWKVWTVWPAA